MTQISIAKDFSKFPIGKSRVDGPHSGQAFLEDYLLPKLREATAENPLIIDLDDTIGLTASFLEAAFGGLVKKGYKKSDLEKILRLVTTQPSFVMYEELTWEYIEETEKEMQK